MTKYNKLDENFLEFESSKDHLRGHLNKIIIDYLSKVYI